MRFADVVGHERQIDFLRRAEATGHLAHALLFAGPPGVGKRLVADAMAAVVACERGAADACEACAGCHQVAAGSHPDILVVAVPSGKREIPIDSVRQLNQFLRLRPVRGRRKVAIVDDAHLLNLAAQNALLKGLEEPPPGSLMVLVAHTPDALLPTVRSRCQRLRFGPLPDAVLAELLATRLQIPPAEVTELSALAEGSPGRALRLRALLPAPAHRERLHRLADLGGSRYGAVVHLATEFSKSDDLASLALESVLRACRQRAVEHAASGDLAAVAAITARADRVSEALTTLRRRNVNRQLLLEALFATLATP